MAFTKEQVENYRLRKGDVSTNSFMFRVEDKPGIVKYTTITVGKTYRVENPNNRGVNGKLVEVVCFVYDYSTDLTGKTPIGVGVNFLSNNKRGTYYDVLHLKEI